jgi:hypothetical protein
MCQGHARLICLLKHHVSCVILSRRAITVKVAVAQSGNLSSLFFLL